MDIEVYYHLPTADFLKEDLIFGFRLDVDTNLELII
jgi:hypothetical protein